MGKTVKTKIIENINKSKYYAILFDSTPNVSQQDQLSQIVRYVQIKNNKVSIEERFIDFIATKEKTGSGLASNVVKKLQSNGLDINNCRGQGFDNEANMAGKVNGVQSHILRLNKLATFVPCTAHSLNLVGVHAAETSPTMITFFRGVQKIYVFFSSSTSKWNKIKEITKITSKIDCGTRWSSKKQAVFALHNNVTKIYELL